MLVGSRKVEKIMLIFLHHVCWYAMLLTSLKIMTASRPVVANTADCQYYCAHEGAQVSEKRRKLFSYFWKSSKSQNRSKNLQFRKDYNYYSRLELENQRLMLLFYDFIWNLLVCSLILNAYGCLSTWTSYMYNYCHHLSDFVLSSFLVLSLLH